jgi:16S rRNA (cytidine1402-2'-O)-methyltransferase
VSHVGRAVSFHNARSANGTIKKRDLSRSTSTAGTLFVVATPIGNLEDITIRALRVLREVALIAAEDTRRTAHLLARHAIATPTTSLHEHNERKKTAFLVDRLMSGDSIALVSDAGTPTISDPGAQLVAAAVAAGIRVEPIPGPSAILAALTASGLPFDSFSFMGFPPTRGKERSTWFERLAQLGGIVVFFEAPHRIERTLADLRSFAGNCPIFIGRELTKAHEELVRGPIDEVLRVRFPSRGEFTVVADIGQTTDLAAVAAPTEADLAREFGELTENKGRTRRQAISDLARRHRMAPNTVYGLIERAKHSGN